MGKSEKQMDKEHERNQRIIDTAFRLFVEKKIESVRPQLLLYVSGFPYYHTYRQIP